MGHFEGVEVGHLKCVGLDDMRHRRLLNTSRLGALLYHWQHLLPSSHTQHNTAQGETFDEQKGPSIEELISEDDVDCLTYMGWQVDQTIRDPREVELEKVEAILATEILTEEAKGEFLESCEKIYSSTKVLAVSDPSWIKVCGVCGVVNVPVCTIVLQLSLLHNSLTLNHTTVSSEMGAAAGRVRSS